MILGSILGWGQVVVLVGRLVNMLMVGVMDFVMLMLSRLDRMLACMEDDMEDDDAVVVDSEVAHLDSELYLLWN